MGQRHASHRDKSDKVMSFIGARDIVPVSLLDKYKEI